MGSPTRNHRKYKYERKEREPSRERDRYREHRKRSTSPEYKRRRSSSRGRKDDRRRYSRSRSPIERSKDYAYKKDISRPPVNPPLPPPPIIKLPTSSIEQISREEKEMKKLMGFSSFDTTKGKKVTGNDVGEVHVILKRKYRQYMNRKGGFNRPLDFVA